MLDRDCLSIRLRFVSFEEAELGVGRALSIGEEGDVIGELLRELSWDDRRMCDASGGFG